LELSSVPVFTVWFVEFPFENLDVLVSRTYRSVDLAKGVSLLFDLALSLIKSLVVGCDVVSEANI
jgi:hypothetical protein